MPPTHARLLSTARQLWRSGERLATTTTTPGLPDRAPTAWLSDLRARIGKCLMFGCTPAQVGEAAGVLRVLATDWRQLVAGNDGFLSGSKQGLDRQRVVWGEMDAFVCLPCLLRLRGIPSLLSLSSCPLKARGDV